MARASQSQKTGARRGAGGRIAAGKTAAGEGEAERKNAFFHKKTCSGTGGYPFVQISGSGGDPFA